MSGPPIKSPWEIINRATPGVPGANDEILYAPQPGTPFVTEAKSTTLANISTAIGGGLFSELTQIPHAQILTLPTLGVTILTPQGATKFRAVFFISMWANPLTVDYTNVNAAATMTVNQQVSSLGFGALFPTQVLTGQPF